MKKILLNYLLFLLICFHYTTNAQNKQYNWTRTLSSLNNQVGHGVQVDKDGFVYSVGFSNNDFQLQDINGNNVLFENNGQYDGFICKYNYSGDLIWLRSIGNNGDDYIRHVSVDDSGYVYVTGYFSNNIDLNPGAGSDFYNSKGGSDIFIVKLTSDGDYVWGKTFGSISDDKGFASVASNSGDVYITGGFSGVCDFDPSSGVANLSSIAGTDIFIVKLNSLGVYQWSKACADSGDGLSYAIKINSQDEVVLNGYFFGSLNLDPVGSNYTLVSNGNANGFIAKFTHQGQFLSAIKIGSTGDLRLWGLEIDYADNIIITGQYSISASIAGQPTNFSFQSNGGIDCLLAKFDTDLNVLWANSLGGIGSDISLSVDIDTSGNIYMGGYFESTVDFSFNSASNNITSAGLSDLFYIQVDENGNIDLVKTAGGADHDYVRSISVSKAGDIYTQGYQYSSTIDYNPDGGVDNFNNGGGLDCFLSRYGDPTTSIHKIETDEAHFSIFPNPSNNILNIDFNSSIREGKIKIYNSIGSLVYTKTTNDKEFSIDVSFLVPGYYVIEVSSIEGDFNSSFIKY